MQFSTLNGFCGVTVLTVLGACEQPAIWASDDSMANRLAVGMTAAEVLDTIGPSQFQSVSDDDPAMVCRSYIYDEAIDAKFVHVMFADNQVVSARDGFGTACNI